MTVSAATDRESIARSLSFNIGSQEFDPSARTWNDRLRQDQAEQTEQGKDGEACNINSASNATLDVDTICATSSRALIPHREAIASAILKRVAQTHSVGAFNRGGAILGYGHFARKPPSLTKTPVIIRGSRTGFAAVRLRG
jgi:hypothetical protein